MSGSGNMIPQSMSRIRSSTSMQAQLRPISPRPPRKTTRTGLVTPGEGSSPSDRSSPPGTGRDRRGRRDEDGVAPANPPPPLRLARDPPDGAPCRGDQLQGPPDEAEQR